MANYLSRLLKYYFLAAAIFLAGKCSAQTKQTEDLSQLWAAYFNQTRFTNHWGLWTDLHLRAKEDVVKDLSQAIVRLGITYYAGNTTKFTAGYAYVHHYPTEAHKKIAQPEHRPWQQVQWHTQYAQKRMMQLLRLEERYRRKIRNDSTLGDGNNFNFRLRYNFFYDLPLSKAGIKPGKFSFVINDEVHINFGKQIVYNYFDQNRLFLGLKYQVSANDNVQLGYMNVFQQLPAGNRYRNNHVVRIFYFQNLDLRKKVSG